MSKESYFSRWLSVIDDFELNHTVNTINKEYSSTLEVFPSYKNIFKCFNATTFDNVRVVILGQDPYYTKYQGVPMATGIAFGNDENIPYAYLSPSLQVLMQATGNTDTTLTDWCSQGVLMLNSAFTVNAKNPTSHVALWRPFISKLLSNLSNTLTGIVYILLGSQAQTFEPYINSKFNYILKDYHPAYYYRMGKPMPNTVFRRTNEIVSNLNGDYINWNINTKSILI